MIPINRTYAPVQALVDELVRCGMTDAVTSPGSRNAPLALTLAAEPRIRAHSVIDERAAGFVALGLAKASGRPVAVACTSGSAAANLMPAVVEAWEARVPLVVLTADRPPELREVGAGQAIDQVKLYGSFAKWFVEVGNHEPSRATAVYHRALGCRAFWTAAGGRPGPVHLNFPLREPLAPVSEELPGEDWEGRPGGVPWVQRSEASPQPVSVGLERTVRGVIVAGAGAPGPELASVAAGLGWPLLADALSGARHGEHDRSAVVAHYDVLLRIERFAGEHDPEQVFRFGDLPTSKPLRAWLQGAKQVAVDPHHTWQDPTHESSLVVAALVLGERGHADPAWLDSWRRADALVPPALAATPDPFEPKVWTAVAEAAPPGSLMWVASSMPVRDVEAFVPAGEKPLRFLANRGANGIDGTIASAAGAALAHDGRAFVLLGDLALVHDLGGLLAARRLGVDLTVVCANNGGGNIFDYLPVAGAADPAAFEEHVVTPSGIDLERVAELAGMRYERAQTPDAVRAAIDRGPCLIEAPTERARNVELHRELAERVAAGL
ncbi:MAG: 2-succinyl-5-enolpyruvyl-6-hydroxy-3-cyclohexene-1-carboxylic-acid synthase [Actinomycetota bacterium]|nr:2-succinyl-5-enolpyruvyl-6-hydroxy-3-cyclohexene-1-carboxylic-acid synthase [Actinomycetota bacterium]